MAFETAFVVFREPFGELSPKAVALFLPQPVQSTGEYPGVG